MLASALFLEPRRQGCNGCWSGAHRYCLPVKRHARHHASLQKRAFACSRSSHYCQQRLNSQPIEKCLRIAFPAKEQLRIRRGIRSQTKVWGSLLSRACLLFITTVEEIFSKPVPDRLILPFKSRWHCQ